MRWIYISPHLDDAILSAGGLIYEQTSSGSSVEIWTLMSGLPVNGELPDLAKNLHRKWGQETAEETINMRRAENVKSAGIVGAIPVHFDFLDCMYRRGPSGVPLYPTVFIEPQKIESDLPIQIANDLSKYVLPDDLLICPLAIGDHVDHVISRRAVELLGRPLFYVADIPYFLNKPYKLRSKTMGLKDYFYPVSESGLNTWLEAIRAYSSQIEMEFKNLQRMEKEIKAYWAKLKGIRLWKTN